MRNRNIRLAFAGWLARIAGRLGHQSPVRSDLIVFGSQREAHNAGFVGQRHPAHAGLIAWWPGAGIRGLAGRPIQIAFVPHRMILDQVGGEGALIDLIRCRMRVYGDRALLVTL